MSVFAIFPKTLQDRAAFCFLITCITSVYFFEVFVVLPKLNCYLTFLWYFQSACGLYTILNIFGNLILMMKNDSSVVKVILPSNLMPGWKFCSTCEANTPPRSFHCDVCQYCVLRRDHHCTFSGSCVGFNNTRYFLALLLHMFLGCLYAAVLNTMFIWNFLSGFSLKTAVMYIFPFVFWILGYLDTKTTVWSFLSVVCTLGGIFVGILLYIHVTQALRNQTTYETNVSKEMKYDLGWRRNLVEVLGPHWILVWLWPTIVSKLPGVGIHFMTEAEYKLNSNKCK